jgi:hypothetical protein
MLFMADNRIEPQKTGEMQAFAERRQGGEDGSTTD